MTDAGLKELAALKNLSTLDLSATNVTGAGMKELAVLKNLTTLYLRGPGAHVAVSPEACREPSLTDAGAKELAALESLTTLDLSGNNVTAAILKELAALKNLIALNLSGTRVTDAEMKELAALRNLRILYLFGCTNLTDDGVKQLATLKNLTYLDLMMTKISDTGLMELSAIPGLAHLRVAGPTVSDAGEKEFERRNPKCDLSVPNSAVVHTPRCSDVTGTLRRSFLAKTTQWLELSGASRRYRLNSRRRRRFACRTGPFVWFDVEASSRLSDLSRLASVEMLSSSQVMTSARVLYLSHFSFVVSAFTETVADRPKARLQHLKQECEVPDGIGCCISNPRRDDRPRGIPGGLWEPPT